jgi:hypothetical protein
MERGTGQWTVKLRATPDAAPGNYEVSLEARVGDRWAPSQVITLSVQKPENKDSGR